MKKAKNIASNTVHQRAEKLLKNKSQDLISIVTNAETLRFIHELEVTKLEYDARHLELESQN